MEQPRSTFHVQGAAIRARRMDMGLEVSALAAMAGISRRYLSHLEIGTREHMKPSRYVALRKALKATDTDLLVSPTSSEE